MYSSQTKILTAIIDGTTTTINNIDGIMYADLNNDSKLDFISYVNNTDLTKTYRVYLMNASNGYDEIM